MDLTASSVNYITLLFGVTRLLVAIYAFFLVGLKGHKVIKRPFQGFHRVFLFSLGLWELIRALFFLYPGTELLPRIMSCVYIPVPFTSLFFFYFCFTYAFPRKAYLMEHLLWLMLVPLITVIFSVVPEYNQYFITFTDKIIYIPYREIEIEHHFWFYIHTAYSYLLVLAGTICLMTRAIHPAKGTRKLAICSLTAVLLFIMENMYRILFHAHGAMWFIPILSAAVLTLFFWIVYADENSLIVSKGQEKLLQTLLFPIFFLDHNQKIIYTNKIGQELCSNIHQKGKIIGYRQDIFENFSPYIINSQTIQEPLFAGENNLLLQSKADGSLYYLFEKTIVTKTKKQQQEHGQMLVFVTISYMKNFLSVLEDKAFKDSLCGCYNRHYLEIKETDFNHSYDIMSKYLPISFIMCDIDGLKFVNDTFGHEKGDEYIALCHDVIKSSVRNVDWIFRLGGDEFLVILCNTSNEVVELIAARIEDKMQQIKKEYPTSISIGTATTEDYPVDYHGSIKNADEAMYKQKLARKQRIGS